MSLVKRRGCATMIDVGFAFLTTSALDSERVLEFGVLDYWSEESERGMRWRWICLA